MCAELDQWREFDLAPGTNSSRTDLLRFSLACEMRCLVVENNVRWIYFTKWYCYASSHLVTRDVLRVNDRKTESAAREVVILCIHRVTLVFKFYDVWAIRD